jgi:hypothetical protein
MTSPAPGAAPADVVDLEALRAACGPVVALYRRFLDGGGVELDMGELDEALASMRRLPPMKGRMGKALALVASGGAQASTEEVIAALELLSAAPGLAGRGSQGRGVVAPVVAVEPAGGFAQPSLPGLD